MEDETTTDGCGPSKAAQEDVIFEDLTTSISSSQPATQPLGGVQDPESEEEEEDDPETWGMLFSRQNTLRNVELTKAMWTDKPVGFIRVGRATESEVHIGDDQLPKKSLHQLSRLQFVIRKNSDGAMEIHDRSSNGTFIDEKKIGKGKSVVLSHNAEIRMADTKSYIFMYTKKMYQSEFPKELTRYYMVSKKLGNGACGTVYLAFRRKDGKRVAIKEIKKKKLNELCRPNLLTNEVRVTKKANHLNIIELYDQIESEDSLYLVLECADGGELFEMIVADGRFSEPVAKVYFLQMLNAVKYLHSIQITHRDLKPENVLVGHRVEDVSNKDSETAANHHRIIKIADMGLSKDETDNTVLKSFVGTPQYIAPEIIVSKLRYLSYTNKCDMWSLGVILYILLTGSQPFRPITDDQKKNGAKDLPQQICDCDYKKKGGVLDDISKEATNLITKLLEFQPKDRLSAQEALDHPWLNDDEAKMKVEKIMKSEYVSKRRSPIPSPTQKRPYPASSDTEETGEIEIISNENKSMNSEIIRPCKKQCLV